MRTPLKVSLVASSGVFLAALLAVLFHHNTINGRTLTPLEQLPAALAAATLFSALSFPTQVRFSGFGLCYNLGIVISGLTPTLLALLVIAYGKISVPYAALVDGALGVALAAAASHIKQYPRAS